MNNKELGNRFEAWCRYYLYLDQKINYLNYSDLQNPAYYGLPQGDKGIDLVYVDQRNKLLYAVQVKHKKSGNVTYGADKISHLEAMRSRFTESQAASDGYTIRLVVITNAPKCTGISDSITIYCGVPEPPEVTLVTPTKCSAQAVAKPAKVAAAKKTRAKKAATASVSAIDYADAKLVWGTWRPGYIIDDQNMDTENSADWLYIMRSIIQKNRVSFKWEDVYACIKKEIYEGLANNLQQKAWEIYKDKNGRDNRIAGIRHLNLEQAVAGIKSFKDLIASPIYECYVMWQINCLPTELHIVITAAFGACPLLQWIG